MNYNPVEKILVNNLVDEHDDYIELISTDHPFSLGIKVFLLTSSPYFDFASAEINKADDRYKDRMLEVERTHMEYHNRELFSCEALTSNVCLNGEESIVIWLSSKVSSKNRMMELVSHEANHVVDKFFSQCGVHGGCENTELRSYYLDWIVGKICHYIIFLRD